MLPFPLLLPFMFLVLLTERRLVEKTVSFTTEEYDQICRLDKAEQSSALQSKWKRWVDSMWGVVAPFRPLVETTDPISGRPVKTTHMTFTGCRGRSKDILLTFMYKEEIACWMQQADQEEQQQMLAKYRPRSIRPVGLNTDDENVVVVN